MAKRVGLRDAGDRGIPIDRPESAPDRHSRLHSLPLPKVGDPLVGSLSGYVTDLASAHRVSLYDLILHEILPAIKHSLGSDQQPWSPVKLGKTWWEQASLTIDGLNNSTRMWIEALQALTLQHNLAITTMYSWSHVISPRGLIRPHSAWCPLCFKDWHSNGIEVFRPLLWSLKAVRVCPLHRVLLQTRCPFPDCGRTQPTLLPHAVIGYCSHCHRELTSADGKLEPIAQEDLEEQLWITEQVGSLLAATSRLKALPTQEAFCSSIEAYIQNELGGNAKALARVLGLHHKTVYDLRDGKQLPQLGTLLKVSSALRKPLADLVLGEKTGQWTDPPVDVLALNVPISRPQKVIVGFSKQKILLALQAIISAHEYPPPSMAAVAEHLGYDQSFLHNHFESETTTISRRHFEYLEQEAQKRRDEECRRIRQAVLQIHEEGFYPSHKRLRAILGGLMRNPYARQVRREMLEQLGYMS